MVKEKTSDKRKRKDGKFSEKSRNSDAHKDKKLKIKSTKNKPAVDATPTKRPRRHEETVEEGKRLWNELRKKTNSSDQTRKLMDELMPLITGKASELALQHDASRVVQAAIQFGRPDERKLILKELCQKPESSSHSCLIELSKSQYAHFTVLKVIKYCHTDDECVDWIVKAFRTHISKLFVHGIASRVVEALFQNLSPKRTSILKQEFYGPHFALFASDTLREQDASVPTLSSNIKAAPDKKDKTIDFVRNLVNKGLEKQLYGYSYFQELLDEFCQVASPSEIRTMAGIAADHCIHLVSTRAGTRAAASLIAYGTAKDRKRIMKSLKGYSRSGLLHHDAYLAVLRLVQLTDDTVSIQKNVFHELLAVPEDSKATSQSPLLDLALSECASKLFLMLLEEKDDVRTKFFDPYERSVLFENPTVMEDGQEVPTSKKDPELRRKELIKHLREPLIDLCCQHTEDLLRSQSGGRVCREVYSTFRPEKLVQALTQLCLSALEEAHKDSTEASMEVLTPLLEDRIGHLTVKNMILVDATSSDDDNSSDEHPSFAVELYRQLKDSAGPRGVMKIAASNRGAFVVEALTKVEVIRDDVLADLKTNRKSIEALSKGNGATAGYVALLNELKGKK